MGQVAGLFSEGNAPAIFYDLLDEVTNADLSIANLECLLISHKTPHTRPGTLLGAPVECVRGFSAAK
jgi:hypothetical protein